ncbi:MAG: hypothetical protein ACD_67C00196G0001, partial [uncultured bacterium]
MRKIFLSVAHLNFYCGMIKISRKILPSFILTAVLAIAGGFSDGMVASAKTVAMNEGMNMQNQPMH